MGQEASSGTSWLSRIEEALHDDVRVRQKLTDPLSLDKNFARLPVDGLSDLEEVDGRTARLNLLRIRPTLTLPLRTGLGPSLGDSPPESPACAMPPDARLFTHPKYPFWKSMLWSLYEVLGDIPCGMGRTTTEMAFGKPNRSEWWAVPDDRPCVFGPML